MSILIVEDDKTSSRIIELTLKRYGYSYYVTENGHSALSRLSASPEILLVISDIMMPDMDGLEMLQRMKSAREFQKIPVIMSTTRADVDTVKQAVKLGCRDYVIKPVNPLQLMKKIERIMENETPVLQQYSDLVLTTRMDRHTYSELVKVFKPLLAEQIILLERLVKKMELLPIGQLDTITLKTADVGASRLHDILEESKELLNQRTGTREQTLAEMQLVLREMKLLQFHLP